MCNAKDDAKKLMEVLNVPLGSYEGMPEETILRDINSAYPEDFPYASSREAVAHGVYELCNADRGWMPPVEYRPSGDAALWGLTDLYDSVKKALMQLIDMKLPFKAGPLSSKKNCGSWSISRRYKEGEISVSVYESSDEFEELVYDATPDGEELSDEEVELALELFANDCECFYEHSMSGTVPSDSTLEEVLEMVRELSEKNSHVLNQSFDRMESFVKDILRSRIQEVKIS